MSIKVSRPSAPVPPCDRIDVLTKNSARMQIEFTKGVETVYLNQKSSLSGEWRRYVWDQAALYELADALKQAARELSTREELASRS